MRLTASYRLPASKHMLLLYKGCLQTKHALHKPYPLPLGDFKKKVPTGEKKETKSPKKSVLANPSALVFLIQEK